MEKKRFLEVQYLTLRKEIEETKSRTFKILVGGVTVVPAAQFLAQSLGIEVLQLLLPFLVMIIMLLFLAENNALMRCGRYIRLHIEPKIPEVTGWEVWLEKPSEFNPRAVDHYVIYSFYLLSALYYIVSVYLAASIAFVTYDLVGLAVALGVYIALGIGIAILLVLKVKATTTTKLER